MRFAWIALLVAGCWRSAPSQAPAPDEASAARRDRGTLFPARSKWGGIYRCSQGLTAVVLDLVAQPDGTLAATFTFGPSRDNPDVKVGAYRLSGTIQASAEGTFKIALQPERWIGAAPAGYVMTAFTATSSRRWGRLVGTLDHPACSVIDVRRSD